MTKVALVSRVNYPVTVKYGDDSFVLAAKRRTKKEFDLNKLGPLDPKKVTILK